MRVLTLVHQPDAGAGIFGDAVLEAGHESIVWTPDGAPLPRPDGLEAAMVFGGAVHVDQEAANPWLRAEKELLRELVRRGTPLLGVCLGHQLVAEAAGGKVRPMSGPEIGWLEIELTAEAGSDPLLAPLPQRFEGFQWHSYATALPPEAIALAHSPASLQAFRLRERPVWGLQFHAEVRGQDLGAWLDGWHSSSDAVASGLDPERIRSQSEGRIGAWNEVGRGIARRFLETAARYR